MNPFALARPGSFKEAAALAGVCAKKWRRWVRSGIAPKPINPGERFKVWSLADIRSMLRCRESENT